MYYKNMQIRPITTNISLAKPKNNTPFTPLENNNVLQKPVQSFAFMGDISLSGKIQEKQKTENDFFNTFLKKPGKVTKEEYIDIVNNHPSLLVRADKLSDCTRILKSKPQVIAKAAICLKDEFDSKFNNYRVISIGTSPSSICEVMNLMNCEVVFIPASGLGAYDKNTIETYRQIGQERFENIPKICEYLKNKGVKKDNSTKNILIDYTSSGKSLNNMRSILIDYNRINPSDIFCCSIIDYLSQAAKKEGLISNKDIECIKSDMATCSIDSISNTPHFYIEDVLNSCYATCSTDWICAEGKTTDELFAEFENFSKPSARAFSLSAINHAQKISEGKNFSKINFCANLSKEKEKSDFEKFILKKGKISKSEYENIAKNHPEIIVQAKNKVESEKMLGSTPEIIAKCALDLKKYFDSTFENKRIISIGTSPSGICEVMENLGLETIYVPITGLREVDDWDMLKIDKIAKYKKNIRIIIKYLRQKGVYNEKNKENILIDFSSSGQTIKNMAALLVNFNKISPENIYKCSITDDLTWWGKQIADYEVKKLEKEMLYSDISIISNTPHFYLEDEENRENVDSISSKGKSKQEVYKDFEEYSKPYARAFILCAIDYANRIENN